jgi:hypothetical protein
MFCAYEVREEKQHNNFPGNVFLINRSRLSLWMWVDPQPKHEFFDDELKDLFAFFTPSSVDGLLEETVSRTRTEFNGLIRLRPRVNRIRGQTLTALGFQYE